MDNAYTLNGYKDREDYLQCMAEDYDISLEEVKAIADSLGETEDFDGLVMLLQDYKELVE
jgi:hypothetical protein